MSKWLPVQIAVGVAAGIVLGEVAVYVIALQVFRGAFDQAAQLVGSVGRIANPVAAMPPAVIVPAVPSCRPGEVAGQVNGEAVCVGRSSGATRRLGQ